MRISSVNTFGACGNSNTLLYLWLEMSWHYIISQVQASNLWLRVLLHFYPNHLWTGLLQRLLRRRYGAIMLACRPRKSESLTSGAVHSFSAVQGCTSTRKAWTTNFVKLGNPYSSLQCAVIPFMYMRSLHVLCSIDSLLVAVLAG